MTKRSKTLEYLKQFGLTEKAFLQSEKDDSALFLKYQYMEIYGEEFSLEKENN